MRRRRGRRAVAWTSPLRVALIAFAVLALVVGGAFTAANIVNPTRVDHQVLPNTPEAPTRPAECSGITTTRTVTGTGVIAGTSDNDWLIGSGAIDTMSGFAGNDCIEGKEGADIIEGGLGNDVCIGGPGLDTFVGCETQIQ